MKLIQKLIIITTALSSLQALAGLSGQYQISSCSGDTQRGFAIPFIGNGLQVSGVGSYINIDVSVDQDGDTILDLDNNSNSFSWPLIALDMDNYKNAKYEISKNRIAYKNKGRSLGMCGSDSNLSISYPCLKKSDESWSFIKKPSGVVIYEAKQAERALSCELKPL